MSGQSSATPLASICVPIYNGEAYLADCLDCICAQTLTDFEVIIVDDNSTDRSLQIAEDYARRDSRFKIHRNSQRRGLVGNWNHCLELAHGEWIKFLFQDDLLEDRCLERLISSCTERSQRFAFCRRRVIFDEHASASLRAFFEEHQNLLTELYGEKDHYFDAASFASHVVQFPDDNIIGEPTVTLFHRSLFKEFGVFTPALIQLCDMEYWIRLGTNVGVVHVAEFLASFRVHGQSTTSQNYAQRLYAASMLDPLIAHYLFLNEKPYAAFRRQLFQTSGRLVNGWRLIWMAHKAWKTATERTDDPQLRAQWEQTIKNYPRLKTLALAGRLLMPLRSCLSAVRATKPLKK